MSFNRIRLGWGRYCGWVLPILLSCTGSQAGLLAESSRIVYLEQKHEKSLMLANTNPHPVLTQVWVDDGSNNPDYAHTPFVVLPAIFQMQSGEIKGLRFIYNGLALPTDRESMYWLNLYEIPAVKTADLDQNHLHLAINTQLKLFFRPKGLKPLPIQEIAKQLKFHIQTQPQAQLASKAPSTTQAILQVDNPTAYHVSLRRLDLLFNTAHGVEKLRSAATELLIQPKQHLDIALPASQTLIPSQHSNTPPAVIAVEFVLIDDDGQSQLFNQRLP
ncbi:P pilus assembly chaperone PapD [Acinetobacter calcoaceticus]|uniref:P pilus assembly chaperone PapD n=1 Tax=Acinetobacter calcoaceticus TaxID=471 RepID=A0A4R1XC33_ACICA|nr:P pilus assembly chaperone PapD [Acinetobacter calcoaceticus]